MNKLRRASNLRERAMEKQKTKSTPQKSSRMIDQLEKAGRESQDPAEKDRLAWLVTRFRNALVGGFVKRSSDTEGADSTDET